MENTNDQVLQRHPSFQSVVGQITDLTHRETSNSHDNIDHIIQKRKMSENYPLNSTPAYHFRSTDLELTSSHQNNNQSIWTKIFGRSSKETSWKIKVIFVISLASVLRKLIHKKTECLNYVYQRDFYQNHWNYLVEGRPEYFDFMEHLVFGPKVSLDSVSGNLEEFSLERPNETTTDDYKFICCYQNPKESALPTAIGQPFIVTKEISKFFNAYISSPVVKLKNLENPIPVTILSNTTFEEHKNNAWSWQTFLPGQKVIVYDNGLNAPQVEFFGILGFFVQNYFEI